MSQTEEIAAHLNPVLQDDADFILQVPIDPPGRYVKEQMWAKQVGPRQFLLRCIPFFVRGLALHDLIETDAEYVFRRVVRPSGHRTFRIMLASAASGGEVVRDLMGAGHLVEPFSDRLFGIDAADADAAARRREVLRGFERRKVLEFEDGN